mgnify:FL=1
MNEIIEAMEERRSIRKFKSIMPPKDIHRVSCTLVFAIIRVRKHGWDNIT